MDHYLESVTYEAGRVSAQCACGFVAKSKKDEDETEARSAVEEHIEEATHGGH